MPVEREHHVFYVPGLNDERKGYELLINSWSIYRIVPNVHRMGWHKNDESFRLKIGRLLDKVNQTLDQGKIVSLVGGSAGGSAVLNALIEQPEINAVVNICGRLRAGKDVFPPLDLAARNSTSFRESVLLIESREEEMNKEIRDKVLNLIPLWDEVVPKSTVSLKGANNKTIYSVEHMLSGFLGITLFSPIIMKFIKDKASSAGI